MDAEPAPREPAQRRFVTTVIEVEGREETKVVEIPAFEPLPWGPDTPLSIVGTPVVRVDAREKVTGRAVYTSDIERPGMLHAVFVRAPISKGRVTLDVSEAERMPGVRAVLTAANLPPLPRPLRVGGVGFLDANVSYAGQPIAVVCADMLFQAERAADHVRVTYERTAAVVTAAQALAPNAPAVRRSGNLSPTSPEIAERGDVTRGLEQADVVVKREFRTSSQLHTAMEPHGAVAEWEGDRLTIWEGTQGIFKVRDDVASALGVPRGSVRVQMEHMGGGFGAKNNAGAHTYAAALLARLTARAVRCVLDREGEQRDTGHRPPATMRVTMGATKDGRLTAIEVDAEVALGVAGWEASTAKIFHELYACPNVRTSERYVFVNTGAMSAFRGPGHTEGAFAQERMMDILARELGLDPLELRLRNYAPCDQEKDRPYSSSGLRQCYEEAARRFGYSELRAQSSELTGGRIRRGIGLAAQIWPTGGGPPAYATVRLHPDGTVDVLTGTQDLGTGARTILAQVAAEALGVRVEQVRVVLGDTERTPYTANSWGSMTTPSVAPAVRMAAEDAKMRLLEAAAEMLGCRPDELDARNGMIDKRDCTQHIAIAEVTKRLGHVMIMGHGSRGPNRQGVALMTFGVHFAEVEVDIATGAVRVLRVVAVHDVGRVINPLLAGSQLEGGILQGLGFALYEERIIDENLGVSLAVGMHDYKIPTMADMPLIDASCLPAADPTANHVGARGLAEPPVIPVAPAIANAVADALGVEVNELPLTPWRVLAALGR
jgi:CO/xanthine dehydrogenase Mo-binding subunit